MSQGEIQRDRRQTLEKERNEKARKERDRVAALQRLCIQVEDAGGLWTSSATVDDGLAKLTTGKRGDNKVKLEADKNQISFRKKVLHQNFPAALGNFSLAGELYTLGEMIDKLKAILVL